MPTFAFSSCRISSRLDRPRSGHTVSLPIHFGEGHRNLVNRNPNCGEDDFRHSVLIWRIEKAVPPELLCADLSGIFKRCPVFFSWGSVDDDSPTWARYWTFLGC